MRTLTRIAAAALALAAASAAHAAERVVFFDDFDGAKLDRAKWNVVTPDWVVNNEQQAYVDTPEAVSLVHGVAAAGAANGALRIRASYRPGARTRLKDRTFDFTSGRLDTRGKFAFRHGTASARIRMTAGQGLWPAFWALGEGKWPDTGEIDIMENVGEAGWTSSALHGPGYFGDTPFAHRAPLPADANIEAWHVYSVDWSDAEIVFRVDGAEHYRLSRSQIEAKGPWAFDNAKYMIVNMALGGGYPQGVNKVAAPYAGLPQATVDLIKAGKAEMLVDWVKVVQRD